MGKVKKRKTERLHVPVEFKTFVMSKRAEDPLRYRTNYDVLNDLMEEKKQKVKRKYDFWGKI